MNLLVVDDQVTVADGIVNSIDWKNYGFHNVFSAYSAIEARQVLMRYPVDIMLSDIEMPYETGLDLLKWVNEQQIPVKCIVLTSHAEFDYAQQALKLGSIDYILQPAAYEEIRDAVLRVVEQIQRDEMLKALANMGKNFSENKEDIVRALFISALEETSKNFEALDSMKYFPGDKQNYWLILFHVTEWGKEHWTQEQTQMAIDNVCGELFAPYHQEKLVSLCGLDSCAVILWSSEELISELFLKRQLEFFYSLCRQYHVLKVAIYARKGEDRETIGKVWKELTAMKQENIMHSDGVFMEQHQVEKEYRFLYKGRWLKQIKAGYGETVRQEIQQYIDQMAEEGSLTKDILKRFYSEFLQLACLATGTEGDLLEKILVTKEDFELYYGGFESIENMKRLVDRVMEAVAEEESEEQFMENVVPKAQKYVHEHITEELRRDEIAEYVHMNADYLSKLFKKELGLSLKGYVLQQKMRYAQTLLKTTNLPIGVVATMVGYDNFSHFSQTYKKIIGERPVDTRGEK